MKGRRSLDLDICCNSFEILRKDSTRKLFCFAQRKKYRINHTSHPKRVRGTYRPTAGNPCRLPFPASVSNKSSAQYPVNEFNIR